MVDDAPIPETSDSESLISAPSIEEVVTASG